MGAVMEYYIALFEPGEDPEQERKRLEEEKEWEAESREIDSEPWPIDEEKQRLVEEKCARAGEKLRLKRENESQSNTADNQRLIG